MAATSPSSPLRFAGPLLALSSFALFASAIGFDFIQLDDPPYVTQNPYLGHGLDWDTLRWALTTRYFHWWHPLTWISHLLDVRLFGMWAGGHHLTSVLLHALNTWLAWTLLVRLELSKPRALLATALFAFHPLRVESIAWVSERKDVLSVCFALLTVLAWVSYRRAPSFGRYAVVALAFGAALASKVMVMTLPVTLAVLDFTILRGPDRPRWRLVIDKLPLLAMSAAAALAIMDRMRNLDVVAHPFSLERISVIPWILARYVANTVWPAKLCIIYPRLPLEDWQLAVGVLTVLWVTGLAVFLALRHRRPGVLVGWALFLLTLSPVLGIGQGGEQLMADRYTHLGHLALFAGLVLSLPDGWFTRRAPALLLAALVLALFVRTLVQLQTWSDSDTLFAHALEVEPNNPPAQKWVDGLALARLLDAGRMEEGEALAQSLLQRWPKDVELWVLSGTVAARAGNYSLAITRLDHALELDPGNDAATRFLALVREDAQRPRP